MACWTAPSAAVHNGFTMQARAFWRTVTVDRSDLLDRFLRLLASERVRWCVVGGLGVNAYVEPVVTLDLNLALAVGDSERLQPLIIPQFRVQRFPHSINIGADDSDLRIQIQTDPRYAPFVERATVREVLGVEMPVASIEDILQGKIWAFGDSQRRASKRQKDLADIARILESFPSLRDAVPSEILDRLV